MASFRYDLSLRIEHPSADLALVCSQLGMTPKIIWRAGEPRTTPVGNPLTGNRDQSYCSTPIDHPADFSLAEALDALLDRLMANRKIFDELAATGGSGNVFVGWYSGPNSGERFDPSLLSRHSALGLSLDLDVYC